MATINLTTRDDNFSDNNVGNRINALAGADVVRGEAGNDRIFGGEGNDALFGGNGDDQLFDPLKGRYGALNRLDGGAGRDLIQARNGDYYGRAEVLGGAGADTLLVSAAQLRARGEGGDDTIAASTYSGDIFGGDGDDRMNILVVEGGLRLSGGPGNDALRMEEVSSVSSVFATGGPGNDILDGRAAEGSFANDVPFGTFDGGAGNDTIFANGREMTLTGGPGRDRLVGNDDELTYLFREADFDGTIDRIERFGGENRIDVSPIEANDRVEGTQDFLFVGQDRTPGVGELGYYRAGSNTNVTLNFGDGVEEIVLVGVTQAPGMDDFIGARQGGDLSQPSDGDDRLFGTAGPDTIDGLDGNDLIDGRAGADRLIGGFGTDTLYGRDGDDVLIDTFGRLFGGAGDDRLDHRGDAASSELTGGSGRDEYLLGVSFTDDSSGEGDRFPFGSDVISGFQSGEVIDVRAFDADVTKLGNQAFEFIGPREFTGPGQLRYDPRRELFVQANTDTTNDGDLEPQPEYELFLPYAQVRDLFRSDFVL